tara:strand:- start:54 stop:230 length:177 start_codon:yes stop_codon:yes gene_type:complete
MHGIHHPSVGPSSIWYSLSIKGSCLRAKRWNRAIDKRGVNIYKVWTDVISFYEYWKAN